MFATAPESEGEEWEGGRGAWEEEWGAGELQSVSQKKFVNHLPSQERVSQSAKAARVSFPVSLCPGIFTINNSWRKELQRRRVKRAI